MARPAKANVDGTPAKPARPVGPKKLYLILNEGADKEAVKASIAQVTFNGRKLLEALAGGEGTAPFLIYKIEVDKRGEEA